MSYSNLSVEAAEIQNDMDTGMTRAEEAEQARKGHEEWERVRVGLLADDSEEFKGRLNDRICDEFQWTSDLENELSADAHVMDLYKLKMLPRRRTFRIEQQASILASIIVGADHE